MAVEHRAVLEPLGHLNYDSILQSRTLAEFDDRFTIHMWGFRSIKGKLIAQFCVIVQLTLFACSEYYDESSNKGKLDRIKVPTLCIAAADDMFAPVDSLPIDEIQQSSHVAMIVTQRGGHIGFMEGLLPLLPFYSGNQLFASVIKLIKLT